MIIDTNKYIYETTMAHQLNGLLILFHELDHLHNFHQVLAVTNHVYMMIRLIGVSKCVLLYHECLYDC